MIYLNRQRVFGTIRSLASMKSTHIAHIVVEHSQYGYVFGEGAVS